MSLRGKHRNNTPQQAGSTWQTVEDLDKYLKSGKAYNGQIATVTSQKTAYIIAKAANEFYKIPIGSVSFTGSASAPTFKVNAQQGSGTIRTNSSDSLGIVGSVEDLIESVYDGTTKDVTIKHKAITTTQSDPPTSAGRFVSSITTDGYGHITAFSTELLENATLNVSDGTAPTTVDLATETLVIAASTPLTSLSSAQTITISHDTIGSAGTSGGDFITSVTTDSFGHISSYTTGVLADLGVTYGIDGQIPYMNATGDAFIYTNSPKISSAGALTVTGRGIYNPTIDNTYAADLDWSDRSIDSLVVENLHDDALAGTYSSIYMRARGSGDFVTRLISKVDASGQGEFVIQTRFGGSAGVGFTSEALKIDSGGGVANVSIPNGILTIGDGSGAEELIINSSTASRIRFRDGGTDQFQITKVATNNLQIYNNGQSEIAMEFDVANSNVSIPNGSLSITDNGNLISLNDITYTGGGNTRIDFNDQVGTRLGHVGTVGGGAHLYLQTDSSSNASIFLRTNGNNTAMELDENQDVLIPNGSLTIADTASTAAVDTYLGGITSAGKIEQVTVVTAAASGSGSLALADNVLTFTPPDISVSGTPTLEQVTSTGNTSTSAIRATSGSYANHFKIERTGYSGANITVTSQTTGVATQMAFTHDAANGGFLFRSRNGSSVDVDALAINEDGLVGINNLNPAYSLDIGGVGGAGTVLNLNSGQTSTYMRVGTNGGTSGYFYGNNSGEVGILDNVGSWAVRVGSGGNLVSLQDSGTAYMGFERRASRGRFIVGTNDVGTLWDQADRSAIIVDGSGTSSSPMVGLTQSGSGKGYIIASSSQISLIAVGSNDVGIGNETFGASSIFFDGSSGYLGINQTTPSRMLHVSGVGSSVDSRILMSATDHSGYSEMGVVSGGGFTQVYTSAGSLGAIIRGYTSAGTYSDAVQARITVGDIEVENGSVIAYGGKFTGTLDSSAKTDVGFGMLNSQFLYGLSASNQYARRLIGRDALDFVVIGESGSVIPAGVKYYANNATSGYHAFYTNSTNERLKIDGNGMSTFTRTGTIGVTTGAIMSNSWILVGTETSGIGIDTNEIYAQGSTLYLGSSDATNAIRMYSGSTERARLSSDGVWYVADNIIGYSTALSDPKLKYNQQKFDAVSILKKTKGYQFQWKDTHKWDFGFMADEAHPWLVNEVKDGLEKAGYTDYLTVHYEGYIPILTEGWNNHEVRLTELETKEQQQDREIEELRRENQELKQRLDELSELQ